MGARSMVRVKYTTDTGYLMTVKQEQQIATAAGNVLADGTEGAALEGFTPRHVEASWFSAGGAGQAVGKFTRKVVIGSVANPLYTHADVAISLPDYDSVPGAAQTTPNVMREFQTTGRIGERLHFPHAALG
jgi:hypothetical protein